ncbi:molybdopterin-dependent oxidoreductase [Thermomonas sp.]|uniref:molybdopterin-dependent oxidoreductase n=1 Tax=Thermomonas sp. TaxID=1971895 RepID=UPI0024880872|nr:molybdopterin-dependent oxidoreductase [Thermomonas sp.]MDI1252624.1 molybdopterin-dependent oxidoreductase [Thermomonas sp.]
MRTTAFRACDLCEAICGLEFGFEDDALVAIRGDAADPFSQGHICPKGNAIIDLEADPDRLRVPMLREGSRWRAIGWDEAFAIAGSHLAAIQQAHGPASVAAYLGNPNVHHFGHIAYLPSLLRMLRTPNIFSASSVDQWPHQFTCAQMYGHQFLLPIPDIDHTDYFLMLGANPMASNGSLMTAPGFPRRLKALMARGKLVVVDPRHTETAAVSSQHIAIRPGGDALFLIELLKALLEIGPPRLDGYAGRVAGLDRVLSEIAGIDTTSLEAETGVAPAIVVQVAAEFHAAPRAVAYGRMGVSVQPWGTLCQYLLQLVNLVTGNLDRVGGSLPNEPAIPITGPGTNPGTRGRWHSRVRGLPEFAGELPVACMIEEIATPGLGQVRALLTCAGNPVLSTPDGRALDNALEGLEFMVAIDIYINETTRHADLILPPASPLTQDHYDSIFNAFAVRRVARLNRALHDRPEGERADWEIINGIGAAYSACADKQWRPLPSPRELIDTGLARGDSGLDMQALDAAPHGIDLGPLRPSLLARLQTASGCIECAPAPLMDELTRFAARDVSDAASGGLRLIGRRHVRSNNSWMHNAPRLAKGKPRHQLLMHPDDMAARGLCDGARVSVRSRVGEIHTDVQADCGLMPGVACLPHGFGHGRPDIQLSRASTLSGESYNDLTDPLAVEGGCGNAALNALPIEVEALV